MAILEGSSRHDAAFGPNSHLARNQQLQELAEAKVAVSPGIGFGEYGEDFVRFGLIENEHRTRQAIRNIKRMIKNDGFA